ncbi:hypothetical protein QYF57_20455 [Paenibacillus polymyxa]|nr:hypothetical protein [Paenibacillus polymyxa]
MLISCGSRARASGRQHIDSNAYSLQTGDMTAFHYTGVRGLPTEKNFGIYGRYSEIRLDMGRK